MELTGGGWVDRVPIPDYKSGIGYFSNVKSQNQVSPSLCFALLAVVVRQGAKTIEHRLHR